MSSWKRKQGICSKCQKPFYDAIGLQPDVEWNDWTLDVNQMSSLQRWWTENCHLCSDCELPYEETREEIRP